VHVQLNLLMNVEVVESNKNDGASGWESIFAKPMVANAPSLGVNFVEASKPYRDVVMPQHGIRLELEQRLDTLGIAGVVSCSNMESRS